MLSRTTSIWSWHDDFPDRVSDLCKILCVCSILVPGRARNGPHLAGIDLRKGNPFQVGKKRQETPNQTNEEHSSGTGARCNIRAVSIGLSETVETRLKAEMNPCQDSSGG